MRKNLGISLVEKLILIFLIFMSLGENLFLSSSPDSGASLAPSFWIADASFGSELARHSGTFRQLDRRLVRLGNLIAFSSNSAEVHDLGAPSALRRLVQS